MRVFLMHHNMAKRYIWNDKTGKLAGIIFYFSNKATNTNVSPAPTLGSHWILITSQESLSHISEVIIPSIWILEDLVMPVSLKLQIYLSIKDLEIIFNFKVIWIIFIYRLCLSYLAQDFNDLLKGFCVSLSIMTTLWFIWQTPINER